MELNMSIKQLQALSPQMMQSMEILQMGSQELLRYIEETVQENPVLEPDENNQEDFSDLRSKIEWLDSTDTQDSYYQRQDAEDENDPLERYGGIDNGDENLYDYVNSQLQMLELSGEIMNAAEFIVESLNSCGWLDEDVAALAQSLGCSNDCMEYALEKVQSLDPAGIAARSLSECLRLQLLRLIDGNELALRIVETQLDALAKSRFGLIAKELNATLDDVHDACDLIKQLNPKPGMGFSARENLAYINPDIFVVNTPNGFELLTNDYFFPSLKMSSFYQTLATNTDDSAVKEYLDGKLRQAKWVVHSIEQRRSTIINCSQYIVERQEDFFRNGAGHLVPMSLADIASKLEVHKSTISRAIRDKYLQCSMGVYPLSYFFARNIGAQSFGNQDGGSPDAAKALLKRIIATESPQKPFSDQKLCELMNKEKCLISRRTVAKYRDELNIPSTTGRKKYE